MDVLFVNRFTGEKERDPVAEEKSKLSKLLSKIEKRKKLKKQQRSEHEHENEHNLSLNKSQTHVETDEDTGIKKKKDESGSSDYEPPRKKSKKLEKNFDKIEGFTILGSENFNTKQKARRILPKWLLHPTVISGNLDNLNVKVSQVEELDNEVISKLIQNGIQYFFPVQAEVIPWLVTSSNHSTLTVTQDVCVSAPTGSGKTLVFVLPIIQLLKGHSRRTLRALVILPTQSLAFQIYRTFMTYSKGTGLNVGIIVGDKSFQTEKKELILHNSVWGQHSKVDILVCTPGKLVDHLKSTEGFNLADIEYLVIDEADRVLESVQDDWLYHLGDRIKEDRHKMALNVLCARKVYGNVGPRKLLFSATLSQDPEKLQRLALFQPKLFTCVLNDTYTHLLPTQNNFIGKYTTPNELSERYVICTPLAKPLALYTFLRVTGLKRVLIFTGSIQSVHRLKLLLQFMFHSELNIDEISSNQSLGVRENLMNAFMNGVVDVLVCTDSVARGIDFPRIDCVISYTAAKHIKTYIHRAGRTARAGEFGLSVTFLQPEQKDAFLSMLEHGGKHNLECIEYADEKLEENVELYNKALEKLKKSIAVEAKNNLANIKKQRANKRVVNIYKTKTFKK